MFVFYLHRLHRFSYPAVLHIVHNNDASQANFLSYDTYKFFARRWFFSYFVSHLVTLVSRICIYLDLVYVRYISPGK